MWACSSVCIYSDSAVLNFGLRLHLFNLFVEITDEDHSSRFNFCLQLQDLMSSDDHFLEKAQFSDEATFHVSGAVNRRNVRIWGCKNPHAYVEHQRDSPKVNMFCAISSHKVYGPFFFAEETVTGMTYLDMLQLWLMPKLQKTLDMACVWKWPTTVVMAPEVPWHYAQ